MCLLLKLSIVALVSLSLAEDPTTCPMGYARSEDHCFLYVGEEVDMFDATLLCDIADGDLVEIASAEEQLRVKRFLDGSGIEGVWLGATNYQGEYLYLKSRNQQAMKKFQSWATGHPNKTIDGYPANCARLSMAEGYKWVSHDCHDSLTPGGVLCEVRLEKEDPIVG